MSDLPRWRARSDRGVRFAHTSRTSWPRPIRNTAVCRPQLADALDPPAGDLPELPRPRLQLAVPLARDAKVRRGENPAARDRRPSRSTSAYADRPRPHCPHDRASSTSATVPDRASSLFSSLDLTSRRMLLMADRPTTSRWTPLTGANAPIKSGRSSKARTEADTSSARHPRRGVRSLSSQTSVQPSTLREPSPARAPRFNTGIAFHGATLPPPAIALATERAFGRWLMVVRRAIASSRCLRRGSRGCQDRGAWTWMRLGRSYTCWRRLG